MIWLKVFRAVKLQKVFQTLFCAVLFFQYLSAAGRNRQGFAGRSICRKNITACYIQAGGYINQLFIKSSYFLRLNVNTTRLASNGISSVITRRTFIIFRSRGML